jgi:hypothetical protein
MIGEMKMPLIVKNMTIVPIGVAIETSGNHITGKGILMSPPGVGITKPTGQYLSWLKLGRFGMGIKPMMFATSENCTQ